MAYRLQAVRLGDLDSESQRLLDYSGSPEKAGQSAVDLVRRIAEVRPGTVLGREWNGRIQRVAVRADGFAWNDDPDHKFRRDPYQKVMGWVLPRAGKS